MFSTIKKAIAASVLLLSLSSITFAQGYRILTAADFQGTPKITNYGAVAYTNCSISYNYQVRRLNGVFKLNFNVQMVMNKGLSWLNRSKVTNDILPEVLKHEQGHYIIAYLQQQEVLRTFSQTRFGRDYSIVVANIFNRIDAKYHQLNLDYEADTNHMQNRVQQVSWDKYFAKCLDNMPVVGAGY
ncbi:hypothetical protein GCM10023149_38920 [Mucilaginibacter gynuensis]|uniref:DUF922 domain-containing protein n=1 Tax=Mucilaginibacter gynuensis TaxID=1302236 RepID=A0ABP8H1B3_9SPHI